jgi:hypothetical protein
MGEVRGKFPDEDLINWEFGDLRIWGFEELGTWLPAGRFEDVIICLFGDLGEVPKYLWVIEGVKECHLVNWPTL